MILVPKHGLTRALELLGDMGRITVVEPVAFVTEPNADSDAQPQRMRLVQ